MDLIPITRKYGMGSCLGIPGANHQNIAFPPEVTSGKRLKEFTTLAWIDAVTFGPSLEKSKELADLYGHAHVLASAKFNRWEMSNLLTNPGEDCFVKVASGGELSRRCHY